jgi:CheY-like chemotaxis protein
VNAIQLILGPVREIPFPRGVNMSAAAVRILVVGNSTANTESTLRGLARSGWESHAVKTVREADTVLRLIRFQLTLATEKLPDGTGYELAALVAQQSGSLFISVALSESCLWLPAVENGVGSLGQRAWNPQTLATEAEFILRTSDTAGGGPESYRIAGATASGERVRAEALPARTVAQLTDTERFGRQVRERYEQGEQVAPRRPIAPQRQVPPGASEAAERPLPLAREPVVREVVALGKRWRGL